MDFPLKRPLQSGDSEGTDGEVTDGEVRCYRPAAETKTISAPMQRVKTGGRKNKDNSVWATVEGGGGVTTQHATGKTG